MSIDLDTIDAGPSIRRDRFGRYLLPDPATGKEKAWTRVTTFADTLDDRYNLERWKLRQTALGLAARKDLLMGVASSKPDDKRELDKLCDQAMEAAKSSSGANLGTALHRFTEAVDRGETPYIPEPYDADLAAYVATMGAAGLVVMPGMIECVVCVPELDLCGTFDRIVSDRVALATVADVKTGGGIEYAMGSIAIQLACYAHGTHRWTGAEWVDMAEVDQNRAIVIHLPAGRGECHLLEVDIAAGWEAAQHAAWVRGWRKRRDLHALRSSSYKREEPGEALNDAERDALRDRALAVIAHDERARPWMALRWPSDVPSFRSGAPMTAAHLAAVERLVIEAEAEFVVPFDKPDVEPFTPQPAPERPEPWQRPDDGPALDEVDAAALRAHIAALAPEQGEWLRDRFSEANAAGRPLTIDRVLTLRAFEITRAALALAAIDGTDDEFVRHLLAATLGTDAALHPSVTLGAALGSLTLPEAKHLAEIATAYGTTVRLAFNEDGTPRLENIPQQLSKGTTECLQPPIPTTSCSPRAASPPNSRTSATPCADGSNRPTSASRPTPRAT